MKAFFDTNVYINAFFKKKLARDEFAGFFDLYEIGVCPVVKHELFLGAIHPRTRLELGEFFDQCPLYAAPSAETWSEMTGSMKKMGWKENSQQNDLLIALTAREEGASLISYDTVFERLRDSIGFELILLANEDDIIRVHEALAGTVKKN